MIKYIIFLPVVAVACTAFATARIGPFVASVASAAFAVGPLDWSQEGDQFEVVAFVIG